MFLIEEVADQITGPINVKTLNITWSELINWHSTKELIEPQVHQRAFWWSTIAQSRFVESIILKLPIPEMIFIEDVEGTGILELVDGFQRLKSVIRFIDSSLTLQGCKMIPELNGKNFKALSMYLQLNIKRSSTRTMILMVKLQPNNRLELRNEIIDRFCSSDI